METRLWYQSPPREWMEGLPIGNGRLAAMVWGDRDTDRLSLNHEWLWRGVNRERDNEPAAEHLPEIRDCLRRGDFFGATALSNLWLGGRGGASGIAGRVDPYQPAGDLVFTLEDCRSFDRRELDIGAAVAAAERTAGGNRVSSRFMAHGGCGLILCRWSAQTGRFSGTLRYERPADGHAAARCVYEAEGITYDCAFDGGIAYRTAVTLRTDGRTTAGDGGVRVEDASELIALVDIGTSVKGIDGELASHSPGPGGWSDWLAGHTAAFSEIMGRLSLEAALPSSGLPTDQRVERVREGLDDPALPLLYFNYGRYLLIASSMGGELPANLQGKWNDRIDPPWESDYHFDINLQMNYWMSEAADLPECAEALITYLERFTAHGRKAARDLYGCRGVYLPIQTDAWGRSTPESYGWAVWVGAAPWIAWHVWQRYAYGGDREYLRNRAYPFLRDVALFFEDYLVEDEAGVLQVMPSQSPENRFEGTGAFPVSIGVSAAMDVQLIWDALGYAIGAAEILDVDADSRAVWRRMREHLPPFAIGPDGRLLEWDIPRAEVEPGHRHLSPLYGLHPSDLFNPQDRPAQYEAAARTLDARLAQGGGHTGWSRAWVACINARLGRGAECWRHLTALITDFATVSLLDLHPPRIFQIDGNLGAVEAVLQSLVQCWGGKVHLLRALSPAWPEGRLEGVRLPGGHRLSIRWRNGRLEQAAVEMGWGGSVVLAGLGEDFILPSGVRADGADARLDGPAGSRLALTRRGCGGDTV